MFSEKARIQSNASIWNNGLYLQEWDKAISLKANIDFDKWLKFFGGDQRLFADRLDRIGLNLDIFSAVLAGNCIAPKSTSYPWVDLLTEIFSQTSNSLSIEEIAFLEKKTIFSSFLKPFLSVAKRSVLKQHKLLGENSNIIEIDTLIRLFLDSLRYSTIWLSQSTIVYQLNKHRLEGKLQGDSPEARFVFFMETILGDNKSILALLMQYPVLARLICENIQQTLDHYFGIIRSLIQDREDLESIFKINIGNIADIRVLGDLHCGGKGVSKITFENGTSLIYKPRSLEIDLKFSNLLLWLNKKGINHKLKIMTSLDRGDYGWQEHIEFKECAAIDEVSAFYEKQGCYLALLYFLNATDFHFENVVAHGVDPFLVDLETLFHPLNAADYSQIVNQKVSATEIVNAMISSSVIRTGLLPLYEKNPQIDLGGLGGDDEIKIEIVDFADKKTDKMKMITAKSFLHGGKNLPHFSGKIYYAENFIDEICSGFRAVYNIILKHKEELIGKNGPVTSFKNCSVRYIFRNTSVYSKFLSESTHPKYLENGLERTALFEHFWRLAKQNPEMMDIIASECRDLCAGDIPYFVNRIGSKDIFDAKGKLIPSILKNDSFSAVLNKIKTSCPKDLSIQLDYINQTISLKKQSAEAELNDKPVDSIEYIDITKSSQLNPAELYLKEAVNIGNTLAKQAIWSEDRETINWPSLAFDNNGTPQFAAMDPSLYKGLSGVALFYAYLANESSIESYRTIAKACLQTILADIGRQEVFLESVGGFSGASGIVYLLMHLAALWNAPELLQRAKKIIDGIEPAVEKVNAYDLVHGHAGMLSICLDLFALTEDKKVQAIARRCGDFLIKNAKEMKVGCGWVNPGKHWATAGISHGVSGICLSLLKLYNHTADSRLLACAKAGLAYENSLYCPKQQNWLDIRDSDSQEQAKSSVTWCNGATGIGLARFEMLKYYQEELLERDLELALQKTLTDGEIPSSHCLCHGSMGNLELPLLVCEKNNNRELKKIVHQKAVKIISTVKKDQDNWKCGLPRGPKMPSFMIGLSGIGYQLLRLNNSNLQSALVLEAPASID